MIRSANLELFRYGYPNLNAIEISDLNGWCSDSAKYSNIIATADESQGSCWAGATNKNVWFKFQATSANVTIKVITGNDAGEMRSQQVALWPAVGGQVDCGSLNGSGTVTIVNGTLIVGDWYYISVDDDETTGNSGTFTLCVEDDLVYPFPPGATELTDVRDWCSPAAAYTNAPEPNDVISGSCWTGATFKNRWFKFQATTTQIKVEVKTGNPGYGSMDNPIM